MEITQAEESGMRYEGFRVNPDTGFLDCFTVCHFLNLPLSHLPMRQPFQMITGFQNGIYRISGVCWKSTTASNLWFGVQKPKSEELYTITYFSWIRHLSQLRAWKTTGIRREKSTDWKQRETLSISSCHLEPLMLDWLPTMWASTYRNHLKQMEMNFLLLLGVFGENGI